MERENHLDGLQVVAENTGITAKDFKAKSGAVKSKFRRKFCLCVAGVVLVCTVGLIVTLYYVLEDNWLKNNQSTGKINGKQKYWMIIPNILAAIFPQSMNEFFLYNKKLQQNIAEKIKN